MYPDLLNLTVLRFKKANFGGNSYRIIWNGYIKSILNPREDIPDQFDLGDDINDFRKGEILLRMK